MNKKGLEINGLFVVGIILILNFVYTINTQPVVFGTDTTIFLNDDNNYQYDLASFKSYEEFSSFLKNCSKFNYNYETSPEMLLKNNIEIIDDFDFFIHSDLRNFDFLKTNI